MKMKRCYPFVTQDSSEEGGISHKEGFLPLIQEGSQNKTWMKTVNGPVYLTQLDRSRKGIKILRLISIKRYDRKSYDHLFYSI